MARKIQGKYSKKATQATLGLRTDVTALYIRVSTDKQATEGFGLEAQRTELDKYCEGQGWTVAPEHVYIDAGISGKSDDRPAFQSMMAAAKAGTIQRIVATKLDRIARNLKNLLQTVDELKQYKCALVIKKEAFDTSTPQGMFVLQMLGAVSELERSMIADRVMGGKRQKASDGGYNGSRVPYGYTYKDGSFTVVDEQAEIVRTIFKRFISCESMNSIAISLNDAGIASPGAAQNKPGKRWSHVGIRHMLANSFYAGLAEWDGTKGQTVTHPAIVDNGTYEAAAAKLATLSKGNPDFGKKGE